MGQEDTLNAILTTVQEIKVEQGKTLVYQQQQRKEIDSHQKEIDNLKKNQWRAVGFLTAMGIGWTVFLKWAMK